MFFISIYYLAITQHTGSTVKSAPHLESSCTYNPALGCKENVHCIWSSYVALKTQNPRASLQPAFFNALSKSAFDIMFIFVRAFACAFSFGHRMLNAFIELLFSEEKK